MTKLGIVIAADGNFATVEALKNSICDNCAKKNKIGACDSCPDNDEKASERVVAYNKIDAQVGDKVEYTKNKSVNLIFSLVAFVVPLVCALLAYFVCANFTDDEQIKGRVAFAFFAI